MNNKRITITLFLLYFLFAILLNSVGTVILQVIHHFNVSKPSASSLEAFKDLSIAAASFIAASFLPRIGYKKSMLTALALMALACFAMPLLPSFLTTKLFFMCSGIAFALVKVSVYSSIGLIAQDIKQHAQIMNILEGVFMLGVLSGYWLFAFFIDSTHPDSSSWLSVYWVLACACLLVFALLASCQLDESEATYIAQSSPATTATTSQTPSSGLISMLVLMQKPLIYIFLISAFLSVLIEQGITSWLPTFNNEIMKLPLSLSVQMTSILAAATAIGRLSSGLILKKITWFALLSLCIIGMGLLVIVTLPLTQGIDASGVTGWSNAPIAAFIFPLIGLFMAPIYPVINSLILSALPKYQHAAMTGLIVVFSALGGTTGSLITGYVFSVLTGQTAFYLTLIPLTLMLLTLFVFKKKLLLKQAE